jgi:hypothetical protein
MSFSPRSTSFSNKIVIHIISELRTDFIPHFVYNEATRRFVRGSATFIDEAKREPSKSAAQIYANKTMSTVRPS